MARRQALLRAAGCVCVSIAAASIGGVGFGQGTASIPLDSDDIAGVVTSPNGPEAGVWVIAETSELQTGFRKVVVTDERGRYVVPDLPRANYNLWVRGYGLVDSSKVVSSPGRTVRLTAVIAPDVRAAAEYYPASYWYSMVKVPPASAFPGTGPTGNGISRNMKSRTQWVDTMKECQQCHQMGDKATREIPASLGTFPSSVAAWKRRVLSGQYGAMMASTFGQLGAEAASAMYADWTDRVKAGEVPPAPPRPQGRERNIVITQWDWGHDVVYPHEITATDRRSPTVNANGPVYGNDSYNSPSLLVVDPLRNTATREAELPKVDPKLQHQMPQSAPQPSPYWGNRMIWDNKENIHNVLIDHRGRVWGTTTFRTSPNPAFCRQGSSHPSAKLFPIEQNGRQLSVYDPKTRKTTLIDTCFGSHHLFFAHDKDHTLWTSGVGWLNTRIFDETGDAEKAQGWAPLIIDTNGNGSQDAWVEPGQPADPTKDTRHPGTFYGFMPSPVDGTIWGAQNSFPGWIVRVNPGSNPPSTTLAEVYRPPFQRSGNTVPGYRPRGIDIDREGVVWTGLQSGHLASFDRRKCKVLNGPKATGEHCPEGWTLYPVPGPRFQGDTQSASADFLYYAWIDQFDTFGLGTNVPFITGSGSDSLMALTPDRTFLVFRVPYPRGFFPRLADGRIDDSKAGWKGKGVWATYASTTPWHFEGGKGQTSKAVKFQYRPHPLAK